MYNTKCRLSSPIDEECCHTSSLHGERYSLASSFCAIGPPFFNFWLATSHSSRSLLRSATFPSRQAVVLRWPVSISVVGNLRERIQSSMFCTWALSPSSTHTIFISGVFPLGRAFSSLEDLRSSR